MVGEILAQKREIRVIGDMIEVDRVPVAKIIVGTSLDRDALEEFIENVSTYANEVKSAHEEGYEQGYVEGVKEGMACR